MPWQPQSTMFWQLAQIVHVTVTVTLASQIANFTRPVVSLIGQINDICSHGLLLSFRSRLTLLTAGRKHKRNAHTAENGGCVSGFTYFSTVNSPHHACQGSFEGCNQAQADTRPQNQAHRRVTRLVKILLLAVCRPIVCCVFVDALTGASICVDIVPMLISSVIMVIQQFAGCGCDTLAAMRACVRAPGSW